MADKIKKISGIPVLAYNLGDLPMDALREVLDKLTQVIASGIVIIGSQDRGKACFAASVSDDLVKKGFHAGQLIGKVAALADGGGGGKAEKAQAGGKDGAKVGEAIAAVVDILS